MAEAIKIAVRVRPFNPKETAANQQLCIEMVSIFGPNFPSSEILLRLRIKIVTELICPVKIDGRQSHGQ